MASSWGMVTATGAQRASTVTSSTCRAPGNSTVTRQAASSRMNTAGSTTKVLNYVYGLGGRDVTVESLGSVFADLQKVVETGDLGEPYRDLSVKE